jgi:hypothetical protein
MSAETVLRAADLDRNSILYRAALRTAIILLLIYLLKTARMPKGSRAVLFNRLSLFTGDIFKSYFCISARA